MHMYFLSKGLGMCQNNDLNRPLAMEVFLLDFTSHRPRKGYPSPHMTQAQID